MVCPTAIDRGEGLQIWIVVANILNMQSGTPDKGWSSCLEELVGGSQFSTTKKYHIIKCYTGPWAWITLWNDLSNGKWT
jgi:hypothetical protein